MKLSLSCIRIALLISVVLSLNLSCKKRAEYLSLEGFTQGTTYRIVYSPDISHSPAAVVEDLLHKIDSLMSVYNPSSLISAINRNENVVPDTLFIEVFKCSKEIFELSGGAFDITGAPLFEIWGFGLKRRDSVTTQMIDSILNFVGMDKVELSGGKLIKKDQRVTFNMNAIAQGFTSDFIAREFDNLGVKNYLVEVGGEIFCKGVNSKGKPWRVGIDKPVEGNIIPGEELQEVLEISGKGLATSGNYRKFYEENGVKYSHTIDPRTGYPVRHSLLSATVVAKDAMTADAIATFFMVAGLEESKRFLNSNPDIDAYLVYSKGDAFGVYKTAGIKVH